jgi:agmatine deiminase
MESLQVHVTLSVISTTARNGAIRIRRRSQLGVDVTGRLRAGGTFGPMLRMPAEWAPHERTLMGWPSRAEIWGDHLAEAEDEYVAVAQAIAAHEPLTMLARPAETERAAARLGSGIEVVEMPLDDSWLRDTGPVYVTGHGRRAGVDFMFNAWGHKFEPYADDAAVAGRWLARTNEPRIDAALVCEGGAIATDGEGTVLTTESCLLNPNRNPALTRAEIERRLANALGASRVIWVPYAIDDRDTDGHIDLVAAFCSPGQVVVQGGDDPAWPGTNRLAMVRRCIEGALDASSRALRVIELPVLPTVEVDGTVYAVPYLNYYVCNGAVIVPVTGHPADRDMLAVIADAYPGREVVPVPGRILAAGGGGPHCITQQVPLP